MVIGCIFIEHSSENNEDFSQKSKNQMELIEVEIIFGDKPKPMGN